MPILEADARLAFTVNQNWNDDWMLGSRDSLHTNSLKMLFRSSGHDW